MTPTPTATSTATATATPTPTPTPIPEPVVITTIIDYGYDPLYRLIAADYDSGEFFHYAYDPVGNRLRQETHKGANLYALRQAQGKPTTPPTGWSRWMGSPMPGMRTGT